MQEKYANSAENEEQINTSMSHQITFMFYKI